MAVIETTGLSKTYGQFQALKGLNLHIEKGDIYGFIGPNGAGKTTTIRILSTLLEPTSGRATINGIDVMRAPYEIKKMVGYMPDSFGVYDGMRLREYLDFFGAAYKIPSKKRKAIIDDVLNLTDLTSRADDYVSAFSRGMKQRCCLAKTLIHDPQVLLLDEPASGLDPRARIEIKELLKALRDMGKTILISSHILSELGDMCNKIAIIERGVLLASGGFREIRNSLRQTREVRLMTLEGADKAAELLSARTGLVNVVRSGNDFQFESTLGGAELADVLSELVHGGVRVLHFGEQEGTLEQVFLEVTKGASDAGRLRCIQCTMELSCRHPACIPEQAGCLHHNGRVCRGLSGFFHFHHAELSASKYVDACDETPNFLVIPSGSEESLFGKCAGRRLCEDEIPRCRSE